MSGLSSSLVDMIGWILLHSLWQGAAVAMALVLALRLLRMAPAQARYLAACVAMALMLVLPLTAVGRPEAIHSVVPAPRAKASPVASGSGTGRTQCLQRCRASSMADSARLDLPGNCRSVDDRCRCPLATTPGELGLGP